MRETRLAFVNWRGIVAYAAANPGWVVVDDGPGPHSEWIVIMEWRP